MVVKFGLKSLTGGIYRFMYKGGEGKAQGGGWGTFGDIHISTWSKSVENGIHTILYYFAKEYVCLQGLTIYVGYLPIVTSRHFLSLGL